MNPELAENETYTYASRIHNIMPKGGTQFERVIEILKETPLTNQAVIEKQHLWILISAAAKTESLTHRV